MSVKHGLFSVSHDVVDIKELRTKRFASSMISSRKLFDFWSCGRSGDVRAEQSASGNCVVVGCLPELRVVGAVFQTVSDPALEEACGCTLFKLSTCALIAAEPEV